MLIPIAQKRDVLRPGVVALNGGDSSFIRNGSGECSFHFTDLTIGFVLNRVTNHHSRYGSDKRRPMPLEAGMGWVLPAGMDGGCAWNGSNDLINMRIGRDILAKASGGDPRQVRVGTQVNDPMLVHLAINLHESGEPADTVSEMYRDTMLLALAAHVLKTYGENADEPIKHVALDQRVQRAIDYIDAHASKEVSLDVLAGVAAMSPFYFVRTFKKATGLPPHKFLAARRMEQAKQLLKSTALPIAEVAFRIGYENISHFTKIFRQHTGQTPGAFRVA
jgi:AraC family transcriptional regulator